MKSLQLYKRIWNISVNYYSKAYFHLIIMVALALLSSFLNTSVPFLMKIIIDKTHEKKIYLDTTGIFTLNNLYTLVTIYASVWLFSKLLEWVQNISSLYLSNSFEVSLLSFGLQDFLSIKKYEIDKIDIGKFVSDVNRAANAFSATNTTIFLILIPTLIQTFFMCWYLYKNTNILYSLSFTLFSIFIFLTSLYINKRNKKYLSPIYFSRNHVNSFFLQKVANAYDIKTSNAIEYETNIFKKILQENVKTSFYNQSKLGISLIFQVIIIFIFLLVFMLISAYLFSKNTLSSGDFILVSSYIIMLTTPFLMLSQQLTKLGANIVALSNFQIYLDMSKDQLSKEKLVDKNYFYQFKAAFLIFGEKKLKNFDFQFIKNKKYAIVGESGIGKTTLINHMLGLEKLEKGQLFYKNIDITQYFSSNIFKEIAFVGQKSTLFNGTLRDNLVYNANYAYTDEDLLFYIKELFLDSTLNNYNLDLNTQIDDVYKKFSGGECQRLNIIRALLRKPSLLILDEPTSALDEKTAKKMLDFISSHVKSIILVTHAKYCIEWVDEIIDLNRLLIDD